MVTGQAVRPDDAGHGVGHGLTRWTGRPAGYILPAIHEDRKEG